MELFICIRMDLALHNLQRFICHKTQTNKQTEKYILSCNLLTPKGIDTKGNLDYFGLPISKIMYLLNTSDTDKL